MIIRRIAVDGFGKLLGRGPIEFSRGLTVIAGPNESGKSTLAQCIVRLLFGFPRQQFTTELDRCRPWRSGAPYRARLEYELDDGRAFETTRDFADDVRTVTRALDTRAQIEAWSGARKASPGQSILELSLEAYCAAAFIGPGELVINDDADFGALGERLAAVVGSAGDEGADAAMLALYNFATKDVGSDASRTTRFAVARAEREQADLTLKVATERLHELRATIEKRAAAEAEVDALTASSRTADIVVDVTRLRALHERLRSVKAARASVADAEIARSAIPTVQFISGGRTQSAAERENAIADIERAISNHEIAVAEATSAFGRADGREPERTALLAQCNECKAAIAADEKKSSQLREQLDAANTRAGSAPALSLAAVEQLEAQEIAVDAVESRARNLETHAAISRQSQTPGLAFAPVLLLAAIVFVIGFFQHASTLIAGGTGALLVGFVMLGYYVYAARKRSERIRRARAEAEEANDVLARARGDLVVACRAFGCSEVASVRARFNAQRDRGEIASEAGALAQTLESRRAQLTSLEARLADIGHLERDVLVGSTASDEAAAALAQLFDAAGIPAAPELDQRIGAFRELRSAGERAAQADAAVARARTAVAEALGSFDVDSLRAAIDRLAASVEEASLSGPLPRAAVDEAAAVADRDEMRRKLIDAQRRLAEHKAVLKDAKLPDIAELEERAETLRADERRLAAAAQAALLARDVIDEVKLAVHKGFLPTMNAALGEALATITSGKYVEANLDPEDFKVRLASKERGGTVDPWELSSGTIEQVNLALRAATAQALGSGERVPLILDDALAHADPERAAGALSLLAQSGTRGLQTLLFTQRPDLVEVARRLPDVVVIDLTEAASYSSPSGFDSPNLFSSSDAEAASYSSPSGSSDSDSSDSEAASYSSPSN